MQYKMCDPFYGFHCAALSDNDNDDNDDNEYDKYDEIMMITYICI